MRLCIVRYKERTGLKKQVQMRVLEVPKQYNIIELVANN